MNNQVRTAVTMDDLMRPENELAEVVDGELVDIDIAMMGLLHTIVTDNLYDILKPFVKRNGLGLVHTDGVKYVLLADEQGVQIAFKPDLAFLRRGRIPAGYDLYTDPFPGAPDLAVEVISPGQTTAFMVNKVAHYLRYGTAEVWIIYPLKRELHRYQQGEFAPEVYADSQILQAETLFPGLDVPVAELFVVDAG